MADHPKPTSTTQDHHHHHHTDSTNKEVKSPNLIERAKEEIEALFHHKSPRHHKETHGMSDDIDESTPTNEVVGPNVFERVKEEVEAVFEAFHQKKDSKDGRIV